ncbi:MAG: LuxR family transcriptional regulator [Proteobacteria bacterium]|nr:LuxR family transcriptional regulator [Pseudomonadota bacterium]
MRLSDFIDESNRADSIASLLALMERAADDLGFDRYAYCALTRHERYEAGENQAPAVAHNFPADWIEYYFENGYQTRDPVVLLAPEIERPFLWDTLVAEHRLDRGQQRLMFEAGEAGLRDGVGVPLHGPRGDVCLVTFAAGEGHPRPGPELPRLEVLANQFHAAYGTVGRAARARRRIVLSHRERECLQWVASGKSSWDIGTILGISESTVNFHVRNALVKLDANTRTLAVVKAIRYGLIRL